jgi:hypothetical protein
MDPARTLRDFDPATREREMQLCELQDELAHFANAPMFSTDS